MSRRHPLRWIVVLALLGGAAAALARSRRPKVGAGTAPGAAPTPTLFAPAPLDPTVGAETAPEAVPAPTFDAAPAPRWVAPVDGQCPDGYPIKANDNSGIYHVPSGRFYARTMPERCYATAEDAEADGYRRAKA